MSGSRPGFDGLAKKPFSAAHHFGNVVVPPKLQYLGIRAFCGCEQLTLFTKLDDPDTWRGVYAEDNTFSMRGNFERQSWIKLLPPRTQTRMPLMKSSAKGFTTGLVPTQLWCLSWVSALALVLGTGTKTKTPRSHAQFVCAH